MKWEVKETLVAALRSGKFKQTKDTLCNPAQGGHCCLGVAAELFCEARPGILIRDSFGQKVEFSWNSDELNEDGSPIMLTEESELPNPVMHWAGMKTRHGHLPNLEVRDLKQDRVCLAWLNDNGLTFDQIADVIDYFWEDL